MKLWLLRPVDPMNSAWDYDSMAGFVIRAESEELARQWATKNCGDEARPECGGILDAWCDPGTTSCKELTPDGPAGVVLYDFWAGQ